MPDAWDQFHNAYETKLNPAEETAFKVWKQRYAPQDSGDDYDLRGAFKARFKPDPNTGHWPDTYKKPNHPTFSDQSVYAKDAPEAAGTWNGESYVPAGGKADPWSQFPDADAAGASAGLKTTQAATPSQRSFGHVWDRAARDASPVVPFADPALSVASSMVAAPVAGLAGIGASLFGGRDAADRAVEKVSSALTYQPRTAIGRAVTGAVSYPFEKLAEGADYAGTKTAEWTGSPAAGALVNTSIQALPALLFRGRAGRGVRDIVDRGNRGPNPVGDRPKLGEAPAPAKTAPEAQRPTGLGRVPKTAPSIDELKAAKNAAYKAAEDTGVVISRNGLNRLKVEIVNDLKKEGLDRDLHPAANAALKRIVQTTGQPTLTELETLRKIANDARTSNNPADARLGSRIIEKIDDFEEGLSQADVVSGNPAAATAFKEARALNQRLSKAKTIQKIFDDAEVTAGANYTVSGMENALRQQFKALAKNEKKLRGFTPEERAAIKKVALGGPMENAMRLVGKFAPNGVVSSLAGIGAYGMAGPAGLAVPAAGLVGKHLATRMTLRNANRASELVRGGPIRAQSRSPSPELTTAK